MNFGRDVNPDSHNVIKDTFQDICLGNHSNVILIIALSSGGGGIFSDNKFYQFLKKPLSRRFKFASFSDNEASKFLSYNKNSRIEKSTVDKVMKITNNNPTLLCFYLQSDIDIVTFRAEVSHFVFEYISETLQELIKCVDKQFHEGYSLTPYFLKCAVTNSGIPKEFWESFLNSWGVHFEHPTSLVGESNFCIHLNFPGSEEIIANVMESFVTKPTTDDQKKIPQVLGFRFQIQFFCKITKINIMLEMRTKDLELQCSCTLGTPSENLDLIFH